MPERETGPGYDWRMPERETGPGYDWRMPERETGPGYDWRMPERETPPALESACLLCLRHCVRLCDRDTLRMERPVKLEWK
ncbi:hypothetical protein ACOMHN_019940 [Nucella lapillus]